nr:LOW QUALITY PROTEIN: synapsin-1 [Pan paniscus]
MRGRERAPIQSHGPPRPRVRAVPSVSRTKQSRYGGGRRSLPLLVTRTPPHEWVFAGPPLTHTGTSHAAGAPGRSQRPGPRSPLRADAGSWGAVGTGPHPQDDRDPRSGPRGVAAGAEPPVPPEAETKPRRTTPDPDPGPCGAPLGASTPGAETPARSGDPAARRAVSPQTATSQRSLLAAAPGPTGAQLNSRQSRSRLNNGAPGRGRRRRRRLSPCTPLEIRLGSRSCSRRGAAARTDTTQAHTAPPAARRPAPSGAGRPGPAPRPMGSELRGVGGAWGNKGRLGGAALGLGLRGPAGGPA